jgi:hypothetical protein
MDIDKAANKLWGELPVVLGEIYLEIIIRHITEAHAAGKEEGRREMAREAYKKYFDQDCILDYWLDQQAKGGA